MVIFTVLFSAALVVYFIIILLKIFDFLFFDFINGASLRCGAVTYVRYAPLPRLNLLVSKSKSLNGASNAVARARQPSPASYILTYFFLKRKRFYLQFLNFAL
jgi:hypothetical protein